MSDHADLLAGALDLLILEAAAGWSRLAEAIARVLGATPEALRHAPVAAA